MAPGVKAGGFFVLWYYVHMKKTVKQMNKAELIAYAAEVGREDINEDMTKKEIVLALEEDGLDDVEDSTPEPEKKSVPAATEDKKIVKMIRGASYYAYGSYVFTTDRRFMLMDAEAADAIVKNNPEDFRIATTKEVEDYYR